MMGAVGVGLICLAALLALINLAALSAMISHILGNRRVDERKLIFWLTVLGVVLIIFQSTA